MSLLTKIRTLRNTRPAPEPDLPDVAHAVAIIMDGNARWARKRGLPIAAGHRAGTKALRKTVEAAIDLGVESLAVYAFSTENWARPPEEVELLMEIFTETIERELPDLVRQGVRTRFIGRRDRAPDALAGPDGGARARDGGQPAPQPLDRLRLRRPRRARRRGEPRRRCRAARSTRRRSRRT